MATSVKTIAYAFPALASLTNNTLTNLTQITVYIPESSPVFQRVWVDVSMDDIITATGGSITARTVNLQLGAAGYSSTTNTVTLNNTAENASFIITRPFTSYFTTNWTGTSMTCDLQVLVNQSTGTTLGMVNVCAVLYITYEYDDTAATQIKSVWIPLNAPRTSLPNTKTSHDTVPALDTYLPEASKTYRDIYIVTRANRNHANTTDFTVTYELSALGTTTTGSYEAALSTDVYTRYVWDITTYITTNTTHTFNVWASITDRYHCMQAWMVVTYEFTLSGTTSVMNCLILPSEIYAPFGGTTASDYQRTITEFWIEETTPSIQKIACFVNWTATGNEAGLNARVGTGTFLAYTNTGSSTVAGDKTMMIRNDSPTGLSFARGRNTLSVDIYNTSGNIRGNAPGCFWIVNYTSDISSNGIGSNNKTVISLFNAANTNNQQLLVSATSFSIPETNYFISLAGFELKFINQDTFQAGGAAIGAERLSGEGGLSWEPILSNPGIIDLEMGVNTKYSGSNGIFRRWTGDYDTNRLDLETSRRYRLWQASSDASNANYDSFTAFITYHSTTFTVSGTISGSSGGTVDIYLLRADTGEIVKSTSQTGNGSYSFTWFDDTENVVVMAYESTTKKGISKIATAGTGFDINLSSGGGGETSYTWFG